MTTGFNPALRLIVVPVDVSGPRRKLTLRLALDTGSSHTVVAPAVLKSPGLWTRRGWTSARVRSVTGHGTARMIRVDEISALGVTRTSFIVAGYPVQTKLPIDGLLGLDFVRGLRLTIDFRAAQIDLQ